MKTLILSIVLKKLQSHDYSVTFSKALINMLAKNATLEQVDDIKNQCKSVENVVQGVGYISDHVLLGIVL